MLQTESMVARFARYREECDAFNRLPALPDSDPKFKRHLNALRRADKLVRRAPIRTKQDALAALEYIEEEIDAAGAWYLISSLVKSLRAYIEGRRI